MTSHRFTLTADGVEVGWSRLEYGDPPMGVVWGRLFLLEGVPKPDDWGSVALAVKSDNGDVLETLNGGVFVEDYSAEVGPEAIEVNVLGLKEELYRQHFPHHIQAYEDYFRERN